MGIYFVSPQAAQDLQEIHDYLFAKNPDTANKFLDMIAQKFDILANFPNMGRRRDELSPSLRSFPVDDYLIFYSSIEGGVEVARVVSGYRDLYALFEEQ
ncbi:type II toxin-antitoxin system RelE/ParE family toxin [Calothrix sp. PCC 7507]|uniref:type II toxin-antitoxin system RelE/ParE family toxin n=1 Tax=Calothrix sp. PCC 7507 TaxID=99598 RepID=UPI00029F4782|nr:type II toxin-antitoxin system RelE/ParE family toxin [Calothrix sp. PCC 7507]AFY32245.1 plasmid stabilization system [Calothrix sp. PCC 7507]